MESSLSLAHPHNIDDGGADQKHEEEEEELGSSGSINDALRDGSADRISVDDGGAVKKCDGEQELNSGGGEEERVSRPQVGSYGVIVEEGGCSIMLGNTSRGWGGGLNSDRLGCDWARPVRCGWCGLARSFRSVLKLHICSADVFVYIYIRFYLAISDCQYILVRNDSSKL
jgi:hypothetical protein